MLNVFQKSRAILLIVLVIVVSAACDNKPVDRLQGPAKSASTAGNSVAEQTAFNLDDFGESFVRLALDLGEHDADYVDAYHG
ncbi:MAG: hypothetical protein HKN70_03685, partial [Gammaproteobacteria bacterium]|nr:hypothetical protein [Gammaproteobacteria bacterium]